MAKFGPMVLLVEIGTEEKPVTVELIGSKCKVWLGDARDASYQGEIEGLETAMPEVLAELLQRQAIRKI